MQVILTEEEWLKLKRQSDEDKKTYVKRIDVGLALQELQKEIMSCSNGIAYFSHEQWKKMFERFIERIQ
jgi:hypothetical protein